MDGLFKGSSEQDQLNKIVQTLGTPPTAWDQGHKLAKKMGFQFGSFSPTPLGNIIKNASPEAIDLITQMLQYDPTMRPTASAILTHPYFTKSIHTSNNTSPIWGEESMRENYAKKKTIIGQNRYENPNKNVINIQNNAQGRNLRDLDDWDEDFADLTPQNMKKNSSPDHGPMSNRSFAKGSLENSQVLNNSRGPTHQLRNSGNYTKHDDKPAAYDPKKWDNKLDESLEDDFDVFEKKKDAKKPAGGGGKGTVKQEASKKAGFDEGWADDF